MQNNKNYKFQSFVAKDEDKDCGIFWNRLKQTDVRLELLA